jgi:cysteine desulfurase
MRELEREGFEVTYLDVLQTDCSISRRSRRHCDPDTSVVSAMFVNNEIGVIQDIPAIGEICRARGIIFPRRRARRRAARCRSIFGAQS